jgi:DNA-binding transcriptional MocR family regulator
MKQRLGQARKIIQTSFPVSTKVNDPAAGYTLWVELPTVVDTMVLFGVCREQGITVGPGQLFRASHRYRHCLRLSFSGMWGPLEQAALAEVGRLARQLVDSAKSAMDSGVMEVSRTDFMCPDQVSAYDLR